MYALLSVVCMYIRTSSSQVHISVSSHLLLRKFTSVITAITALNFLYRQNPYKHLFNSHDL